MKCLNILNKTEKNRNKEKVIVTEESPPQLRMTAAVVTMNTIHNSGRRNIEKKLKEVGRRMKVARAAVMTSNRKNTEKDPEEEMIRMSVKARMTNVKRQIVRKNTENAEEVVVVTMVDPVEKIKKKKIKYPKKCVQFAESLQTLFQHYPALSTELPYLLIQLTSGDGLNLSQMRDEQMSISLSQVFTSMGCKMNSATNCWVWEGGQDLKGLSSNDKSLLLIKMAIYLLDGVGVTMEAIDEFDNHTLETINDFENQRKCKEYANDEIPVHSEGGSTCTRMNSSMTSTEAIKEKNAQLAEIALLTTMVLEKFDHKNTNKSGKSLLAKELFDIVSIILESGESICLDGISNDSLKECLEKLFFAAGLEKVEMMEEEEDDNKNGEQRKDDRFEKSNGTNEEVMENMTDGNIAYGYSLPDEATKIYGSVKLKLNAIIRACKLFIQMQSQSKVRVLGPAAMPLSVSMTRNATANKQESNNNDDDDDDGPLPLGSEGIGRRKAPKISAHMVNVIAKERSTQLAKVTSGIGEKEDIASFTSGREEWMMQPGEHDFLKGIMASGVIKNRKFENKKTHDRRGGEVLDSKSIPLDTEIQSEVNGIMSAHAQARGPSLVQQHREKKMEKESTKRDLNKGSTWNWNRDKDLDKGRRVDKQYLRMVMGGASQELKEKFQDGTSSSFM